MWAAQGLAWREPSAKSQTAPRSCLLTAQRKVTALCLPDWRVDGAAPAKADQCLGVGEAGPAVADLGQQPGGADGARAGQRGEDVPVSVLRQLGSDLGFQRLDLGVQAGQHG